MSQADIPGAAAQTSTESQLWRRWEFGQLGQRIKNPAARIAATAGLWAFAAAWLWIAGLLVYPAVGALIAAAWMMVLAWYGCFGLLLVPYRLVRRSSRRRRVDEARHRELLDRVGGQA